VLHVLRILKYRLESKHRIRVARLAIRRLCRYFHSVRLSRQAGAASAVGIAEIWIYADEPKFHRRRNAELQIYGVAKNSPS